MAVTCPADLSFERDVPRPSGGSRLPQSPAAASPEAFADKSPRNLQGPAPTCAKTATAYENRVFYARTGFAIQESRHDIPGYGPVSAPGADHAVPSGWPGCS